MTSFREHPWLPDYFQTFVGGMGPTYRVEWVEGGLHFTVWESRRDLHPRLFERLQPQPDAWNTFWEAALGLRADRWAERYENHDVLDGTVWEASVRLPGGGLQPGLEMRSSGSNRYPSREGLRLATTDGAPTGSDAGTDDSREVFAGWCRAVSALVGRPFR